MSRGWWGWMGCETHGNRHESASGVEADKNYTADIPRPADRLYAIRLPDGRLITDPDWHTPADVMRGAHGHGVTAMPGELVVVETTEESA